MGFFKLAFKLLALNDLILFTQLAPHISAAHFFFQVHDFRLFECNISFKIADFSVSFTELVSQIFELFLGGCFNNYFHCFVEHNGLRLR